MRSPDAIGPELCDALGLDADVTRRITITVSVAEPTIVEVVQWGLDEPTDEGLVEVVRSFRLVPIDDEDDR